MNNNKKGISAIVATVLIILITVAAVTIIWAAIIPMINNQLTKGTICLDAVSQVSISDIGYTCYDSVNDQVDVQVKRGSLDFDLDGIQLLVSDDAGNSFAFDLTTGMPNPNEEKVIPNIDVSTVTGVPTTVSIAPIVKIGNSRENCEISSSRKLPACA